MKESTTLSGLDWVIFGHWKRYESFAVESSNFQVEPKGETIFLFKKRTCQTGKPWNKKKTVSVVLHLEDHPN